MKMVSAVSILHATSQSACLVRSMGLASVADRVIGASTCSVWLDWQSDASGRIHAQLAASEGGSTTARLLPLGHQGTGGEADQADTACCCPVLADDLVEPRPPLQVRMGAVAIPMNSQNEVLLTRRPRSMRTFPGAWVLPGGSVDATDASVVHAALRELEEETGIVAPLSACEEPLCLWESCFPVSFDEWAAQRREEKPRTAHFLISFIVVRVGDATGALRLQPEECDNAVWVPLGDVAGALSGGEGTAAPAAYPAAPVEAAAAPACSTVDALSLAGVYPNGQAEGVGRGHLWALRRLLEREKLQRVEPAP